MISELEPREKGYSAQRFINNLEVAWGGNLYFEVRPSFTSRLADIIPRAPYSLSEVSNTYKEMAVLRREPIVRGVDIIEDFKELVTLGLPHPERASSRIHLLADYMCREELLARLEQFLCVCGDLTDEQFPIEDALPFRIHGDGSILFDTQDPFTTLEDHIDRGVDRRDEMANRLGLQGEDRKLFRDDFEDSLEETLEAIGINKLGNINDLHPSVELFSREVDLQFNVKRYHFNQKRTSM